MNWYSVESLPFYLPATSSSFSNPKNFAFCAPENSKPDKCVPFRTIVSLDSITFKTMVGSVTGSGVCYKRPLTHEQLAANLVFNIYQKYVHPNNEDLLWPRPRVKLYIWKMHQIISLVVLLYLVNMIEFGLLPVTKKSKWSMGQIFGGMPTLTWVFGLHA